MMQEVEVLKTIPELVCSYFPEEQFTLSSLAIFLQKVGEMIIMYIIFGISIRNDVYYNYIDTRYSMNYRVTTAGRK